MAGVALLALLFAVACGKKEPPAAATRDLAQSLLTGRSYSTPGLIRGGRLYQENCAECHGPQAQGHPDWPNPRVNAAPPLDGHGDVWQRRKQDLIAIVNNGVSRQGQPVMPAWKGRLSERDIEDIIAWYQALWPADVYDRWLKANSRTASPKG